MTTATAAETAAQALLGRLGIRVPIEVVDARVAFTSPPSEPVVRITQVGESWVTPFSGGSHARTAHALAAEVRVVGYGVSQPDFRQVLVNAGRAHVKDMYRSLSDDIDLLELEVVRGPGGKVGKLSAWSVTLTPVLLTTAPPLGGGQMSLRTMAIGVAGKVGWTKPRTMGEGIAAEATARVVDPGTPDEDGIVSYTVAVDVKAAPTSRQIDLGYTRERTEAVLNGLQGAFAGVGRVAGVQVEVQPASDVREIRATATLIVVAWDAPSEVRR